MQCLSAYIQCGHWLVYVYIVVGDTIATAAALFFVVASEADRASVSPSDAIRDQVQECVSY